MTSLPATASSRRCADLDPQLFKAGRQHGGRRAAGHLRVEFFQGEYIRPGNPAVDDVPDNRDLQAVQGFLFFPHGEEVKKGLGGMLVSAVAGVDDRGVEDIREHMGRTRHAVPDDDDVGPHRFEVPSRVLEGLPFRDAARACRYVDGVGGETLGGDLERDARPGARLVKKRNDRFAPQGGDLLDVPPRDVPERIGRIEKQEYLFPRQLPYAE